MLIRSIMLHNFRSFSKASFKFSPQTTVIVGPNTSGKTNLLEGIYLLGTGKSFRANIEEEMIKNASDFARVTGRVDSGGEEKNLEVFLGREKNKKKKLAINRLAKRLVDYQGTLRVVLFGPWDLNLITDSPSARRKFLDNVLSQVDREYRRSLLSYEKGLRSRNRLLEYIREGGANRSQLLFWDQLLIKNGDYIAREREEFIAFANNFQFSTFNFQLEYDRSAISQARLAQYAEEEVMAGATLVGPHRDDVVFKIKNDKNLAIYGSRGEQRMCILWLKLTELAFIEKVSGEKPVLLLDDIFSELDHRHREIVMQIIQKHQSPALYGAGQTIITTADPHTIAPFKYKGQRIKLV